ncbi:MAG: hypothetical protein U0350_02535 [Caldilineaceae bacterium]
MATQNPLILKPRTPLPSLIQSPPRQERYQIITADNGERYVLDRVENKLYRIVQPTYKAISA